MEEKKYQQIKSDRTRQQLLETAYRLFRNEGIESVTVRQIAQEAGVTTGTLYYYFSSKQELLQAYYEQNDRSFGQQLQRLEQEEDPLEAIIAFFGQVMAAQVTRDGKEFTKHRMFSTRTRNKRRRLNVGVVSMVERAQQSGQLTDSVSAQEITEYLFLVFRGAMYAWCSDEWNPDLSELFSTVTRRALCAFLPR